MKKIKYIFPFFIFALLFLTGCSNNSATVKLHYSAAASLKPALTEIYKTYQKSHSNVDITMDFAGSGAIREKVLAGAPIDGVFLASQSDIAKLGNKVAAAKTILSNQLVLIAPKPLARQTTDWESALKKANKIAIGQPASVPAGMYAQQTLQKVGLYDSLSAKLVQTSDVTQVLNTVASGNADLGFVYQTDALTNKQVSVIKVIPENLHAKILYLTATVTASSQPNQVKDFNSYLASSAAQTIFKKYGFITD